ncbi:viral A-type inclusion protein [Reticulomyxa filosa]|uniref:Viral A-type inclusion protein n=1 Tax=Reticulomyxa filosa TaxID=46433 RepID=X6MVN9_RETFI|nr:viral A-type inclusion protein [Reticulomyxa filosa]|eukprot:ETO18063.1 viral A-type inclusion protein [Reticulomyxa filosa]
MQYNVTQYSKLEQSVEKLEQQSSSRKKTIEELNSNIDQMKLQFAGTKLEFENKVERLSETVDSLEKLKTQLENKVAEQDDRSALDKSTIGDLQKQLEKMKLENETLKQQLTSRNDRIDQVLLCDTLKHYNCA